MSYFIKKFKDYEIKMHPSSFHADGEAIWIEVSAGIEGRWMCENAYVYPPTFLERLLGVTWKRKLQAKKILLVGKLLERKAALEKHDAVSTKIIKEFLK